MVDFALNLASPLDRFIHDRGQPYKAQALPSGHTQGPLKACFRNAYSLISSSNGLHLKYVEGVALDPRLGISIHHAWAADDDHMVYDPTWRNPEECVYFGVVIPLPALLEEMNRTGIYGVLDTGRGFNFDFVHRHFNWQVT